MNAEELAEAVLEDWPLPDIGREITWALRRQKVRDFARHKLTVRGVMYGRWQDRTDVHSSRPVEDVGWGDNSWDVV